MRRGLSFDLLPSGEQGKGKPESDVAGALKSQSVRLASADLENHAGPAMLRFAFVLTALAAATLPARAQSTDQFVGRWGFVSYWNEQDQARALRGARAECGQPYAINRGPNGGVMLHAADAIEPSEMLLRESSGKSFLVPVASPDPANRASRELTVVDANTFITRYNDPAAHSRYGYKVYARCGAGRR